MTPRIGGGEGASMGYAPGGEVKMRSFLYALARLLGDLQAIRRGTVGKRLARRATRRGLGRLLRRLLR